MVRRLAIVGSVEWPNQFVYNEMCAMVVCTLKLVLPDEFVSGGADGTDRAAEEVADALGIPKRIFLPEVPRWDGGQHIGYKQRNIQVAEYCTHLVALRSRQSTTQGSLWTYKYAASHGKWARLIEL